MRIDRNQETNVGGCVSILEKDDSSSVMVAWCELLDRSGGRERERRGHSLCWVFSLFSRLCRVCLFGRADWLAHSFSGSLIQWVALRWDRAGFSWKHWGRDCSMGRYIHPWRVRPLGGLATSRGPQQVEPPRITLLTCISSTCVCWSNKAASAPDWSSFQCTTMKA